MGMTGGIVRSFGSGQPVRFDSDPKHWDCTVDKDNLLIVRNEPEPCRVRLDIEIPAAEMEALRERTVKGFRRQARLPGFRPGKSPRKMIERRFAREIREETMHLAVRETVDLALEKEDIKPETRPRVEEEDRLSYEPGESFMYSISFDVPPHFETPEFRNLVVNRRAPRVDDNSVNEIIDNFREQRASYEPVDRAAQPGDLLRVTYRGTPLEPDTAVSELPESAQFFLTADETWMQMGEPELLPGCVEAMTGAEPGEEREFHVVFPESFMEKSLCGLGFGYRVLVKEVHAQSVPAFTDEMAQAFGAEDVESARRNVREQLENRDREEREQELRNNLMDNLLQGLDFDVPPAIMGREAYDVFRAMLERVYRENPERANDGNLQEELMEQARQVARHRLRQRYVLLRIAEEEKIEVPSGDFDSLLDNMAEAYRMTRKKLVRRLRENGRLADMYLRMQESRTMDHILSMATIVDESADEAADPQPVVE